MKSRIHAPRPAGAGRRSATILDVAARAGVSASTVSRILAGELAPRPHNAEAVRRAVLELGYRPDLVARSMRTGTTSAIGVVIDNLLDPVFPPMVQAMNEAAEAAGYAVVLGTSVGGPAHAAIEVSRLLHQRVDGLIIACSWPADALGARAASFAVPVVITNTEGPGVGLPQYGTDNLVGGRLVAEHLLGLGHRRIVWVGGPASSPADGVRLRGIRDAWGAAGLDPVGDILVLGGDGTAAGGVLAAEALVAGGRLPAGGQLVSAGGQLVSAGGQLVSAGGQAAVTAVACFNDLTAIGLIRALAVTGVRVPDEVSVAGFDDIEAATWVHPGLTTVRQQTGAMGRLAVERLVELIRGAGEDEGGPPAPVRLPMTIRVRGSTAAPATRTG